MRSVEDHLNTVSAYFALLCMTYSFVFFLWPTVTLLPYVEIRESLGPLEGQFLADSDFLECITYRHSIHFETITSEHSNFGIILCPKLGLDQLVKNVILYTVYKKTLWTRFYADISETIHDIFIQTDNWCFGDEIEKEVWRF